MLRLEVCDVSSDVNGDANSKNSVIGGGSKNLKNLSTLPQQFANKRQKGLNKCKNPVNTTEYVDELDKIGHSEKMEFSLLVDNLYYYVHRSCAMWSFGTIREANGTLSNVLQVVQQSLSRNCSFCNRYGASLSCKVSADRELLKFSHTTNSFNFLILDVLSKILSFPLCRSLRRISSNSNVHFVLQRAPWSSAFSLFGRHKLSDVFRVRRCG